MVESLTDGLTAKIGHNGFLCLREARDVLIQEAAGREFQRGEEAKIESRRARGSRGQKAAFR